MPSPCEQILRYGIFDVGQTSSEDDLVTSYLAWLQTHDVGSFEDAKRQDAGINVAFPLEGIPTAFGASGSNSTSSSGTWYKDLSSYLQTNAAERHVFVESFKKANADIIAAWSRCVSTRERGFVVGAEAGEDLFTIKLKFSYDRRESPDPDALVITAVEAGPRNVLSEDSLQKLIGVAIGPAGYEALVERVSGNGTNVVIRTNSPDYYADIAVAALPKPPPPRWDPAKASLHYLTLEFSFDRFEILLDGDCRFVMPDEPIKFEGLSYMALGAKQFDASSNQLPSTLHLAVTTAGGAIQGKVVKLRPDPNLESFMFRMSVDGAIPVNVLPAWGAPVSFNIKL